MFHKQHTLGRIRSRLSYANVMASLAFFMALGGTAAAAVTLGPDSVGSPQIRGDAVRQSEIVSGAVRSSEIRDEGINAGDISPAAATTLRGELRLAKKDNRLNANDEQDSLPECEVSGRVDVTQCPDWLVLRLTSGSTSRTAPNPGPQASEPARNWLVQAKMQLNIVKSPAGGGTFCGLVNTVNDVLLDQVVVVGTTEPVALSAVVKKRANNPSIALRCTTFENRVDPEFSKITAHEVGTVTGP
jgi:hypothetical protein